MRFLVDAQLPPALARVLADSGHEAEHVVDVALESARDTEIWDYASVNQAAVITKDEDFPQRISAGKADVTVVWVRIGNTTRRELLTWFVPLVPQVVSMIESGERLIELR